MEHELIAIKNNTTNPLHLAISTLLPGLADFRRKKHGNLCSPPLHNPTTQGRIKASAVGQSQD